MEETNFVDLDGFDVEMGEYEVVQTQKFDRYMRIETGGSIGGAPLVVGSTLYFASMNHNIYALDAVDGKELWRFEARDRIGGSGPVYSDGMIFAGSYDHNLYCLNAKTGELIWKFRTEGPIYCRAETDGGTVYVGSKDRNLYAVEAATGRLLWKFTTGGDVASMPTAHEGSVFIGSYDRNVYRLDAGNGRLIRKYPTQGEVHNLNRFLIDNGVIYVTTTDNMLRAFRIEDGLEVWKARIGNYGASSCPVKDKDRLYQGTRDGDVTCLDMNGRILWKFPTREVVHIPLVNGDHVYFGSGNKLLYCLDMDGKKVWTFGTNGSIVLNPVIREGCLYFGSWDCHMYCIDTSGNLVWKFRVEGEPSYKPPSYEAFEVRIKVEQEEVEELPKKRYDFEFHEEEESASTYKSEITYQMGTAYIKKGKYQIDSDRDALR